MVKVPAEVIGNAVAHIDVLYFFTRVYFTGDGIGRIGSGNVLYCPIGIQGLIGTHGIIL
jgi:hypothetical protein